MADRPIGSAQFSDEEAHEIIRRAVSADSSALGALGEGLSLSDLQAIAEEVGIDSSQVEHAARTVLRERRPTSVRLLGGPRVLDVERSADGVLAPGQFPSLLATIRRTLGRKGEANEIHGSLEWSAQSETVEEYVTLSTTDGRTAIHASANLSNLAVITFMPAGLVGVISAMIAFTQAADAAHEVGMALCVLAIPMLYLLLRVIYGNLVAAEEAKLEQVVDELVRSIPEV